MVLLRKVIGDALRARRLAQHRTLREVSTAANVSLGYLSEIERGHKEASSELLAAVCDALGARLSDMLADVAAGVSLAERIEDLAPAAVPVDGPVARELRSRLLVGGQLPRDEFAPDGFGDELVRDEVARDEVTEVTQGAVTVQVHSEGPLKTTLTAKRTGPPAGGQRPAERVFAS